MLATQYYLEFPRFTRASARDARIFQAFLTSTCASVLVSQVILHVPQAWTGRVVRSHKRSKCSQAERHGRRIEHSDLDRHLSLLLQGPQLAALAALDRVDSLPLV